MPWSVHPGLKLKTAGLVNRQSTPIDPFPVEFSKPPIRLTPKHPLGHPQRFS